MSNCSQPLKGGVAGLRLKAHILDDPLGRGFGESRFFRMGGVPPVFFYLYGYRINLEKELALYLYALCESLKSYMIKSKYIKL